MSNHIADPSRLRRAELARELRIAKGADPSSGQNRSAVNSRCTNQRDRSAVYGANWFALFIEGVDLSKTSVPNELQVMIINRTRMCVVSFEG